MHTRLPANGAVKKQKVHVVDDRGLGRVPDMKAHLEAVLPRDMHTHGLLPTQHDHAEVSAALQWSRLWLLALRPGPI